MANIQVSAMTADPLSIHSGDEVTLSYSIDGDDGTALTVVYSIKPDFNLYFDTAAGPVQTLPAENFNLVNPPMGVTKKVTIVKRPPVPPNGNFTAFDIRVDVASGGTSDFANANVKITP